MKSADASLVQKVTTFGDAVGRSNRRAHNTRDTDLKKTAVSTCTQTRTEARGRAGKVQGREVVRNAPGC